MEKLTVEIPAESICIRGAQCCNGHSVMDESALMGGAPAIRLHIRGGGQEGILHLNPWYGNHEALCTFPLEEGTVYELYCEECGISLCCDERCVFCTAPMFVLELPRGGLVQSCSRRGCHNHKLKVVDLSAQLSQLFDDEIKPRF